MRSIRTWLVGLGLLACGMAMLWWARGHRPPNEVPIAGQTRAVETPERTLADLWIVDQSRTPETAAPIDPRSTEDAHAISEADVKHALREVRIDTAGDVIVDDRALSALLDGFAGVERLSDAEVAELQRIITAGLPSPAGEQAAKIVGDFYQYQVALRASGAAPAGDLNSAQAELERTIALRHAYFGEATAERLFGDEQAHARFTLASMRLEADASLSESDKAERRETLRAMLPQRLREDSQQTVTPPSAMPSAEQFDWQQRYAEFQRQKQAILAAGLVESEKNEQIDRLLHEHFTTDEIDLALRYESR